MLRETATWGDVLVKSELPSQVRAVSVLTILLIMSKALTSLRAGQNLHE